MTSVSLMVWVRVGRQTSSHFHHELLGMCFGVSEIFDIDLVHMASITHHHLLSSTLTYHIYLLYMHASSVIDSRTYTFTFEQFNVWL